MDLDIDTREYSGSLFIKVTSGNYSEETLCSEDEAKAFARKLVDVASEINANFD